MSGLLAKQLKIQYLSKKDRSLKFQKHKVCFELEKYL